MLRTRILASLAAAGGVLLGFTGTAIAHTGTGGASADHRPQIEAVQCDTGGEECAEGELLRVDGEYLKSTTKVVFLGSRGMWDNRNATPRRTTSHAVLVEVPHAAVSGPVRVRSRVAGASRPGPAIEVEGAGVVAPLDASGGSFPVGGSYDFGTAVNGFGGGRNHKGQDILAKCGTPVLAAFAGRVEWVRSQAAAGNYAVITAADGTSQAYMHMLTRASVREGQRVTAGQQIGQVGETGRATACHLHFELWTAPGWYRGGTAVDPLPTLKSLLSAG
jgi:murein DD-endopeptidase MepM/ murein hydrolase activator NlpD